jgi:E3 ubiquitin-protein ligase TRIP12
MFNGDVLALSDAVKADHGFNTDSRSFRDLVSLMTSYDHTSRRDFLQFITGSPKLPIGGEFTSAWTCRCTHKDMIYFRLLGFRGLNPPLTVVRKPHEAPLSPDDYLPSVMTCVNYLKLPAYSSKEVLAAKLLTAMKEGGGSFHLS